MTFHGRTFEFLNHFKIIFFITGIFLLSGLSGNLFAQSTNQSLPTPLTSNEINGQIKARDIGDARLTTYYYIFNGERGDVFINVVTRNFNGDIDIFTADTLQPRTKITVYADSSNNETGRIVYMRKPEKLILRIQGRTPNDDPATFAVKFAGSFSPLPLSSVAENTEIPKLEVEREGTVRVNSVGTIIEEPKTEDTEKSDSDLDRDRIAETNDADKTDIPSTFDPTRKSDKILPEDISILNPRVIVTDNILPEKTEKDVTVNIEDQPKDDSTIVRIEKDVDENEAENAEEEETVKRLAKISLKVKLKNGGRFERAMNEVLSVNVIKTVLTIVTSDGKIHEFSIFDVDKMTID